MTGRWQRWGGVAATVMVVAAACTAQPPPSPNETAQESEVATPTLSAAPLPPTAEDLARSVVLVQLMMGQEVVGHGSGTVISEDGLILTNAHVATPADVEIDGLLIAVTERADRAPTPRYRAEVVAADRALDLAVIRITEDLDGNAYDQAIPPLELGDSEAVAIGDDLIILGYPSIGGDTITFTSGQVSGFTSDDVLGDRAWIKTDATIAGGNSGGLAADASGRLIGVPTIAAAGEDVGDIVDCRPVVDTNRDGIIDEADECVPIGGFLNGVRPIRLAHDLIAAVESGVVYEPIGGLPDPADDPNPAPADFNVDDVIFGSPIFTDVQPDVTPTEDVVWLPSGVTELCGFWDYEGMADGVTWDAIWTLDGEIQGDVSYLGDTWTGGETGEWWVCFNSDAPIDEGFWDLSFNVEGELINGGFVGVGDALEPVTLTVTNDGPETICYLFVSPVTTTFWGSDWLGTDRVLGPGESFELPLPPGSYDLLGQDCDGNDLITDQQEILADTQLTY